MCERWTEAQIGIAKLLFILLLAGMVDGTRIGSSAEPDARGAESPAVAGLKIAIAQPMTIPGEVRKNFQAMIPLVKAAATGGAHLIVFSECSLTGYDLKGSAVRAAIARNDAVLAEIARLSHEAKLAILFGFYEQDGDRTYNSAMLIAADGSRTVQRKHAIAPIEAKFSVVAGPRERTSFEIDGFRGAILICADDGIENIHRDIRSARCDFAVLMTAGAGSTEMGWRQADLADPAQRRRWLEATVSLLDRKSIERSLDLKLAQVACNQSGWIEATGYFQPGGGWIIDGNGMVTAVVPAQFVFEHLRPELIIGEISRGR